MTALRRAGRRLVDWIRRAPAPTGLVLVLAGFIAAGCASKGKLRVHTVRPTPTPGPVAAPEAAPSPQPTPAPLEHRVGPGDSLWRLARRHLGSGARYPELAKLNAVADPGFILDGLVLKIPSAAGAAVMPAGAAPPPKKSYGKENWTRRPNRSYALGEKLTFAVQYFNITGGFATLSISEISEQQGRPCLHVVAEARSHPSFEWIIKVRDRIETYIDADSQIPWRYEKHLREGGYSADAFYLFDQRAHKMLEPDKGKAVDIAPETQDVLSCFYWFRTMDLAVGRSEWIKVAADDMKSYDLKVDVLRKERVKTLAGDFDCVLVQPHLQFEGVFQQKGQVFIWITDDERRIPVKIKSKIAIGSININLQDADWIQPAP